MAHQHFDKALRLPGGRTEQHGYIAVSRGTQSARAVGDFDSRFGVHELPNAPRDKFRFEDGVGLLALRFPFTEQ